MINHTIVRRVVVNESSAARNVFLAHSTLDLNNIPSRLRSLVKSGGAGASKDEAIAAALGESYERIAAVRFSLDANFYFGCADKLGTLAAKDPWGVAGAAAGGALQGFSSNSLCKWYLGKDLSGGTVAMPGPFIAFPYIRYGNEPRYWHPTTTGLAFGIDDTSATLAGLLECIERDSVALAWNWGLPACDLSGSLDLYTLRQTLDLSEDVDLRVYDITSDLGVPVVIAFATHEKSCESQIIACGAACRLDPNAALRKSVIEAIQGIDYVKMLIGKRKKLPVAFTDVTSFEESAIFYTVNPHFLKTILRSRGSILRCKRVQSYTRSLTTLDSLVSHLSRLGHRCLSIDMTPQDWPSSLGSVVRTTIPTLISLEGRYSLRDKNDSRPRQVASTLDVDLHPDNFPHPLP